MDVAPWGYKWVGGWSDGIVYLLVGVCIEHLTVLNSSFLCQKSRFSYWKHKLICVSALKDL